MRPSERTLDSCVKKYEAALRTENPAGLMEATVAFLDGVTAAGAKGGLVEKGVSNLGREHWYTRAAGALTTYITNSKTRISLEQLAAICRRKQRIAYIFNASGYRNMLHLIDMMKTVGDDGTESVDSGRAAVLLAFISLDDTPDFLMDVALGQPKEVLLHLLLGWLNQRAVLSEQGENNRGRLLKSGDLLEGFLISDREIELVVNAWMYSSYASHPKKHDIKKCFNQLLAQLIRERGITPKPVSWATKPRPKLMVIFERFGSEHAMFRCYAPSIRTLNKHFDTVALADELCVDEAVDGLFDTVVRLSRPRITVAQIIDLIQEQQPDVIWYPSLGMSHWTVLLAGMRLAPIQVMTHGHPATSMLKTIDYAYVCQMEGDLSAIHSERVITGMPTAAFDAHTQLPEDLPALLPPSEREVRIAVNSKVMKLSWRLIDICKRLERNANVPVKFSFFPGELHANMDGLHEAIQAQLPSAAVVPYVNYQRFLDEIAKCDMALAAFPFGNTNSTVDTCLLGLPTVVHFGPESPAQTDSLVLKTAGLPSWLVCDNDEVYYTTALRMINDPATRKAAMAGLNRRTLRERLIENPERAKQEPLGDVLYSLHRHHLTLRDSPKRVWSYSEILNLQD